jgi:hypothetical protein
MTINTTTEEITSRLKSIMEKPLRYAISMAIVSSVSLIINATNIGLLKVLILYGLLHINNSR